MIFLVTEEAVYRHRILGVYDTQAKAEERAFDFACGQDGHHEYVVLQAEMNAAMDDPERVCHYRRERIGNDWPPRYSDPKRHSDIEERKP